MNNLLPRFGVFLLIALALPAATRNAIPSSAKAILERADHLDVLSLDPGRGGSFHGFRTLKTVIITDENARKTVVAAFERAVEENQGDMAVCFNPHHGLRVSRGDKQVDFVSAFTAFKFVSMEKRRANFWFPLRLPLPLTTPLG